MSKVRDSCGQEMAKIYVLKTGESDTPLIEDKKENKRSV
jgi:hypothetical protein